MTAKEMFEELGFEYDDGENYIEYSNYDTGICFMLDDKDISINTGYIDMPLFKAINKQCEELGWNND